MPLLKLILLAINQTKIPEIFIRLLLFLIPKTIAYIPTAIKYIIPTIEAPYNEITALRENTGISNSIKVKSKMCAYTSEQCLLSFENISGNTLSKDRANMYLEKTCFINPEVFLTKTFLFSMLL